MKNVSSYRAGGFTLVELMISLVLGLILTGGVVVMFTANSETQRFVQENSRLQENARFALGEIVSKVRMTGYLGCRGDLDFADTSEFTNTLKTTSSDFYFYDLAGNGLIEMYDDLSALPSDLSSAITPAITADTDVLVIRSLATDEYGLSTDMASATDPVAISDTGYFAKGDVAFISDCTQASVFQITALSTSAGQDSLTHAAGGTGPGNSTATLTGNAPYGSDAVVNRFETTVFFIADSALQNSKGETISALWQKNNSDAAFELVQGISDIELWAGEADEDEEIPSHYIRPSDVTSMDRVVALDIHLSAASIEEVESGVQLERDFSASVELRNR